MIVNNLINCNIVIFYKNITITSPSGKSLNFKIKKVKDILNKYNIFKEMKEKYQGKNVVIQFDINLSLDTMKELSNLNKNINEKD